MKRHCQERAFTLIELLAAVTVLAILMVMLATAFNQGQSGWLKGEKRIIAFQEARKALDAMSVELSQAFVASNVFFTGVSATELRFVAPLNTDTNNQTDLCEVGYKWMSAGLAITRQFTPPEATVLGSTWKITGPLDDNFAGRQPLLSNTVTGLRFDYIRADGSVQSSWPASTNLPKAIRITLNVVDSRTGQQLQEGGNVAVLTNENQRTFTTLAHLLNSK
jgi:prepilin-type N-terminal cleavage/methylation domain-containing protein